MGWSDYSKRYELNLTSETSRGKALPKTKDNKSLEIPRASKTDILINYIQDPITFNSVNLCTTITMKPGFEILGHGKRDYDNFFLGMRNVGDNTSLRRLFIGLHSDRIAYGAAFLEFIPAENGKGIVDLRRVNPVKIDYARDRLNNILVKDDGKPLGFIMRFGANFDVNGKGDEIPEDAFKQGIFLNKGDVFYNPERIAIFPLYTLPNNYDYIGIVEPAIQSINWRRKVQLAQVNAINVKATSPYVITVGDIQHEPTTQMMDDADMILANIDESRALSLPYTMKLGTVESKSLDIIEETVKSLMFDQSSAAGIPLSLLTGAGEATNRSTLKTQRELYESSLQTNIDNFVEDWNIQVMIRLMEENGYSNNATLKWGDVRLEAMDETNKRLLDDIDKKVFSPKEIRNTIKNKEKVIINDKEYEEWLKTSEKKEIKKEEDIEEEDMDEQKKVVTKK